MGLLEFFGFRLPEVLITDVTRMRDDRVCVAGISGRKCVRLHEPSPTTDLLASLGGLAPGDVIRVQWRYARRWTPPHKEDARWRPNTVERREPSGLEALYERLSASAFGSVSSAFGDPKYLTSKGNPAFPTHRGKRSLASITASDVRVYRYSDGLRANFKDADQEWRMLPVESIAIREHFARCEECRRTGEMRASSAALRVGLGRPFRPDGEEPGCFAQVNNVVPADSAGSHFA